jgi:hypothetical protein
MREGGRLPQRISGQEMNTGKNPPPSFFHDSSIQPGFFSSRKETNIDILHQLREELMLSISALNQWEEVDE